METFELARAMNAAKNGRLYCLLVFALMLSLGVTGRGDLFFHLAGLPAATVGFAYLGDRMRPTAARACVVLLMMAFGAAPLFVLLLVGI